MKDRTKRFTSTANVSVAQHKETRPTRKCGWKRAGDRSTNPVTHFRFYFEQDSAVADSWVQDVCTCGRSSRNRISQPFICLYPLLSFCNHFTNQQRRKYSLILNLFMRIYEDVFIAMNIMRGVFSEIWLYIDFDIFVFIYRQVS